MRQRGEGRVVGEAAGARAAGGGGHVSGSDYGSGSGFRRHIKACLGLVLQAGSQHPAGGWPQL